MAGNATAFTYNLSEFFCKILHVHTILACTFFLIRAQPQQSNTIANKSAAFVRNIWHSFERQLTAVPFMYRVICWSSAVSFDLICLLRRRCFYVIRSYRMLHAAADADVFDRYKTQWEQVPRLTNTQQLEQTSQWTDSSNYSLLFSFVFVATHPHQPPLKTYMYNRAIHAHTHTSAPHPFRSESERENKISENTKAQEHIKTTTKNTFCLRAIWCASVCVQCARAETNSLCLKYMALALLFLLCFFSRSSTNRCVCVCFSSKVQKRLTGISFVSYSVAYWSLSEKHWMCVVVRRACISVTINFN